MQISPRPAARMGTEPCPSPRRATCHRHCPGSIQTQKIFPAAQQQLSQRCPVFTAPSPAGLHAAPRLAGKPRSETHGSREGQMQFVSCVLCQSEPHLQLSHGPGAPVLSAGAASRNHHVAMATASHAPGMLITLGRRQIPSSSLPGCREQGSPSHCKGCRQRNPSPWSSEELKSHQKN